MTAAQSGGVLDVSPAPAAAPSAMPAPAPVPAPVATTVYDSTQTQAAPAPVTVTPSGGGSYIVQKGDTLWKIASNHYGDGKQWQKICSANPGLTPETLKAGQTITIP
jgi:5'-nucleotidase